MPLLRVLPRRTLPSRDTCPAVAGQRPRSCCPRETVNPGSVPATRSAPICQQPSCQARLFSRYQQLIHRPQYRTLSRSVPDCVRIWTQKPKSMFLLNLSRSTSGVRYRDTAGPLSHIRDTHQRRAVGRSVHRSARRHPGPTVPGKSTNLPYERGLYSIKKGAPMDLENKVAIVTGGASGMGLATVRRFVEAGA